MAVYSGPTPRRGHDPHPVLSTRMLVVRDELEVEGAPLGRPYPVRRHHVKIHRQAGALVCAAELPGTRSPCKHRNLTPGPMRTP